jgi:hypothetical protein
MNTNDEMERIWKETPNLCDRVIRIPASYSGSPMFESLPEDRLSYVIVSWLSSEAPEMFVKRIEEKATTSYFNFLSSSSLTCFTIQHGLHSRGNDVQ